MGVSVNVESTASGFLLRGHVKWHNEFTQPRAKIAIKPSGTCRRAATHTQVLAPPKFSRDNYHTDRSTTM